MAPRQTRKSLPVVLNHSEHESSSQEDAQDHNQDFMRKAQNLMDNNRAQHDKYQVTIEADLVKRVQELNGKIDVLFEGRTSHVNKSQQILWDRLESLNEKRTELEHQIMNSMKTVEQQTRLFTHHFSVILDGRVNDIIPTDEGRDQE